MGGSAKKLTSAASGASVANVVKGLTGGGSPAAVAPVKAAIPNMGGLTGALGAGGLGGLLGGGSININSLLGTGPGGSPFTDMLGKTDPWNIFHKKDQVDSTAKTMADIKGMLPKFKSGIGPGGLLGSQYMAKASPAVAAQKLSAQPGVAATKVTAGQLDTKALASDPRALDAMRERATAKGDSPWMKLQLQKQGIEETSARDQAANQALSGASNARSQLAMRGGMSSGARERIAQGSSRDMNAARQAIGRSGQMDRLGLGIADDQTKQGLLAQTAGLDLTKGAQNQEMGKFNIGTALDANKFNSAQGLDAGKFNSAQAYDAGKTNVANQFAGQQFNSAQQYDANKYNAGASYGALSDENKFNAYNAGEQMKAYGSSKSADAVQNGGKK